MKILLKKCRMCSVEKPLSEFHHYPKGGNTLEGYRESCNTCWDEKIELDKANQVRCLICRNIKDKKKCQGFKCHSCVNKSRPIEYRKFYVDKYRNSEVGKKRQLWRHAFNSSKRRKIPFNISIEDIVIPKICPIFGINIKLDNKHDDYESSPSLDRLIPELGYIKGNVEVISMRANMVKSCGTAEEHEKIADWIRSKQLKQELV